MATVCALVRDMEIMATPPAAYAACSVAASARGWGSCPGWAACGWHPGGEAGQSLGIIFSGRGVVRVDWGGGRKGIVRQRLKDQPSA
jgi:hypothetical protein